MMKSKDKARKSIHLQGFDYSTPWWYYVTICTAQHYNYFGKIINGEIVLSNIGMLAEKFWKEIPEHFSNTELDCFVIMPNHIHGIIIINECRDVIYNVPTKGNYFSEISPRAKSLSVIIRTYKSAVTRECRKQENKEFELQRNYYDKIIRNEKELFHIRKYIEQNPLKWELEKEVPDNIEL